MPCASLWQADTCRQRIVRFEHVVNFMHNRPRIRRSAICLSIAAIMLLPMHASSDEDDAQEQYQAREALRQGKIRPLEEIISAVREKFSGDIIEIEFEVEDGRYIYELEIIQPSGQIIEIEIDALTKEILDSEEK